VTPGAKCPDSRIGAFFACFFIKAGFADIERIVPLFWFCKGAAEREKWA
jgi:hypothetical protein